MILDPNGWPSISLVADMNNPLNLGPNALPENVTELRPIMLKPEVLDSTGLSYPTIWAAMRRGEFPLSVVLLNTKVGWYRDEIAAWLESRPRSRLKPLNDGDKAA